MDHALEIILHDDIQRIFDNFSSVLGISIIFFSLDRRVLRRGLDRPIAPFCRLVQERLTDGNPCLDMDEEMCRACASQRTLVAYRCHAGIEEAVSPLYMEGQLLGYAMIGQFRTSDDISPRVLAAARKKGLEGELRQAFLALPCYSPAKAASIHGLFSLMTDYIVTKEIVSARGGRGVGRILAFIKERSHEDIAVHDAAEELGLSVSAVAHQLKRFTGRSFTRHLHEARVTRAEEYLRLSPATTLQEVAGKTGFKDPFYFSRVYRKLRGFPPARYRRSLPAGREPQPS